MNPIRTLRAADPARSLPADHWDTRADAVLEEVRASRSTYTPVRTRTPRRLGLPLVVTGITAIAVVIGSVAVISTARTTPADAPAHTGASASTRIEPLSMKQALAIADRNMAAVGVPSTVTKLSASPNRWLDQPRTALADCEVSSKHVAMSTPQLWSDSHLSLAAAVKFYESRVPAGLKTYGPGEAHNGDGTTAATISYTNPPGSRYPEKVLVYILQTEHGVNIRVDSMVNAQGLCPDIPRS